MRSKCVAVLDIRSSEVTTVVGERGVNNTFIIKSKYTSPYDGYADGELIDIPSFISAVSDVVRSTLFSSKGIKTFYVGVPGEFIRLVNSDKIISFQSSKRITAGDVATLIDLATPPDGERWKTVRRDCMYYVLSDKRKVINPVGAYSDSLQGRFCFFKCLEPFMGCVNQCFKKFASIEEVRFIPSAYAQSMYLVEPELRDECAVLFDLGFISSTYSVICGNGLLFSESFSLGIGHMAFFLMNELDIPYDVALTYLTTVNLNAKEKLSGMEECIYDGKTYSFSTATLRDTIREGLDGICETIEECKRNFTGANLEGKPLLITGEGVNSIRGGIDHISGRLVQNVETVAPKVPYYDKPKFSSLFSLLDMALKDENR